MKIGIFYAYWVHNWNVDFHPFIDKASDLGFDVLEVNAGTVANMTNDELKSLNSHANDKGIELSYVVGLQAQYDISSEDSSVRNTGIEFLKQIAESVGKLGGGPVGGILYGSWPSTLPYGVSDKRPFVDRSVISMKEAIKAAEDNNVTFNLSLIHI